MTFEKRAEDRPDIIAIAIDRAGGPEVLMPVRRKRPEPGRGELLVRVEAAGINRPDVLQRQGLYPAPKGASDIPGLEVAGTVVETGPFTARYATGARVTALISGGGYAEYALVPEETALPVPEGLSAVEAAALPETFFTVWSNVIDRAGLKAGEQFLVHGGTSGIGTTAIQIGKFIGASVMATAGSADKVAAMRDLGADCAIDYQSEDYVEAVKAFTGGKGADVILDMVGGDYIERNWKAAAVEGRIVQIAFLNGSVVEADFTRLMLKRLTHTGSTLRARDNAFKGAIARALEDRIWPEIAKGRIRPVIDTTFPLSEAAEAHRRMESSAHIGKIVLTTDASLLP